MSRLKSSGAGDGSAAAVKSRAEGADNAETNRNAPTRVNWMAARRRIHLEPHNATLCVVPSTHLRMACLTHQLWNKSPSPRIVVGIAHLASRLGARGVQAPQCVQAPRCVQAPLCVGASEQASLEKEGHRSPSDDLGPQAAFRGGRRRADSPRSSSRSSSVVIHSDRSSRHQLQP